MPPGSPPECITGDINDFSHPALDGLVISQEKNNQLQSN